MAIQHRRGVYADFDPSKMRPAEPAVVVSGDPNATNGKAAYIAFAAGDVKQLATMDELKGYDAIAEAAKDDAVQAKNDTLALMDQATAAKTAAEAAQTAAETARDDAQDILDGVETRVEEITSEAYAQYEEDLAEASADVLAEIERKGQQIAAIATNADEVAAQALDSATNAENHMATLDSQMQALEAAMQDVSIDPDDLGLEQDTDTYYVYPTYKGVRSENGIPLASGGGGGGGGGDVISAVLTVENTSGWLSKTIASGSSCPVSFTWSSIEDDMPTGDGSMRITVNDIVRSTTQIQQGNVSVDLKPYLSTGTNKVKVRISDTYDQGKTVTFNITSIALSLTSSFDASTVYSSAISFPYTPVGAVEKTLHFILDGTEIGTQVTSVSGRQMTYTIPAQHHGAHSLMVYFEAVINNETVQSNELYYEFIYVEPLNDTVIITSSFSDTTQPQYASIPIPYQVYDPKDLTAQVTISVNGTVVSTQTVDRTEQSYTVRANDAGSLSISISSGGTTKVIAITVVESEIDVEAETENLELYLTSQGRSNNEAHPEVWVSTAGETIGANLTGFNFASDGWQSDEDGITCLRVSGDARVTIPFKPFATDFRATGKTIELEFATRNVLNYDAVILSCMNGGRGMSLTAQKAQLTSEQSSISTQYKEDEHIRIAFVAEKRAENRLLLVYINGIPSGVVQYPDDDDFSQVTPVDISIGSNSCTIDLYCIRVYDNDLTRYQILNNWIADTQDGSLMLDRYVRNNIYDAYGKIVVANLPSDLPYYILNAEELPQYKGDKKTISGSYVDPIYPSRSFTFEGCQINVQGKSSAPYARKNYDMQFKKGFEMASGHATNYALRPGAIPFNRFVLKADVASSEGANNVELVRLYNDACPYKTPEMEEDSRVRWGIDGFPIVVFWNDTATGNVSFLGKYNFNLPKRAPAPYGYADSDTLESWEFQNNTSDLLLFKSDYFDQTPYTDDEGVVKPEWRKDFEARFPSDEWLNTDILQEFTTFVVSTDRNKATGNALAESVTYEDVEYTADTAAYRLAKFRAEFPTYAELDTFLFYYIFTELFLMVDSRAKNLFIGFNGSTVTAEGRVSTRKATAQPYDMDTAVGTNNEGSLVFGYSLEDTDHLSGGANIFNGQDSVLWNNVRDAYPAEIVQMYQRLRSVGTLSYASVEKRYKDHQAKYPEAVWNEDSWFKYIDPLIAPDPGKEPTAVYLPMMQGSKEEQRKWWLSNRFKYMDSKWNAGEALSQVIQLRGYAKDDITVTPYADIYPSVKYGSYLVRERGAHGQQTTLVCPLSSVNDTEIYIYSAPQLASVGDLSGLKVGFADFSMATRLQGIKLGDADSEYSNPNLSTLTLGSNKLLQTLDVRNCTGLGDTTMEGHTQTTVDISGCSIIEEVYFDGTKIQGLTLPNGGVLKKLHLPATMTNLTILNQKGITDFVMPSYANISTLRLENVPTLDTKTILNSIPASSRVRLIGFYWTAADAAEIEALFTKLDSMRGLDEQGGNVDKAQVSGEIHTGSLTGAQIASFNERYPYVRVTADHTSALLTYKTYDGSSVIDTETVLDGGNGTKTNSTQRTSTAQYNFTPDGWATSPNGAKDNNALVGVTADRTVYAAYTSTLRSYTITFVRASADGGGTLQSSTYQYGATPKYTGATPTTTQGSATDYPFEGWTPAITTVTGATTYTAKFGSPIEVAEITDSWDTIIANIDNGTYATKYKVGNYKPLDLGTEGTINMQIVAFDADELASGGTAPITFLAMELLSAKVYMNRTGTTAGGWESCYMRSYLHDTIKPYIPLNVRSRINTVNKTQCIIENESTVINGQTTADSVWIPSIHEITGSTECETIGAIYTNIYKNETSRIKGNETWWLRSPSTASKFKYVSDYGYTNSSYSARTAYGVCLGFCLGLEAETITDSWSDIFTNESNGTYSTKYSVGDTKMLDLGTEGKHLMEIVAMDTDDLADGTGKAKITWLSKTLLNTRHRMNPARTPSSAPYDEGTGSIGGWDKCEMKTYLNTTIANLVPTEVRNNVKTVTKYTKIYNTAGTTVNDVATEETLWLASRREMFGAVSNAETQGPIYSNAFPDNASRVKSKVGESSISWWLRSAGGGEYFCFVTMNGSNSSYNAPNSYGVVLGFCT